ncbi:hypothetical protein Hypma_008606 [Hypsizygus marmoreus]|uniref:Uncharacterized protein n=1 Tax=Hypsizygus marmoreus TaxID=39966 RepID=A0A369JV16_HYPMA|nr:hypothetical protein Hypma_008606 [Hypsizygus marmoreus]
MSFFGAVFKAFLDIISPKFKGTFDGYGRKIRYPRGSVLFAGTVGLPWILHPLKWTRSQDDPHLIERVQRNGTLKLPRVPEDDTIDQDTLSHLADFNGSENPIAPASIQKETRTRPAHEHAHSSRTYASRPSQRSLRKSLNHTSAVAISVAIPGYSLSPGYPATPRAPRFG